MWNGASSLDREIIEFRFCDLLYCFCDLEKPHNSLNLFTIEALENFCGIIGASQMLLVIKNLPTNAGDAGDMCSIPGSRRSSGVGNDNPLLYSCLENSLDGGTWQATSLWGHKESDTTEHTCAHTPWWALKYVFVILFP